jgi:hypothetical protein
MLDFGTTTKVDGSGPTAPRFEASRSWNDLGARKLSRRIVERSADTVGQAFHRYNGEQTDQYDQQTVFNQILAFFFFPQLYDHVLHVFSPVINF